MVRKFLRSERAGEIFRYGLATALSATVTLGLPVLLHQVFGVPARIAVGIAFAAAFVLNFVSTRGFVFKSTGRARPELVRYVIASAGFRLAEYLAFLALYELGLVYFVAQIIVVVASLSLKFATFKRFVYRRSTSASVSQ